MSLKLTDPQHYQDIADAIRLKNGTQDEYTPAEMAPAIEALPTGGGAATAPENDVNFYDFDGTILYSYSASEFLELTEEPDGPEHEGLGFSEWNWNLSDAQAYVEAYGMLDIGALYNTDDGKIHIYIDLPEGSLTPFVRWKGTATIDWGDESQEETATGDNNGNLVLSHTYAAPGAYVIRIEPGSDFEMINTVIWNGLNNDQNPYVTAVKKVELCELLSSVRYAFNSYTSLQTISVAVGVGFNGTFAGCYNLKHVNIAGDVIGNCFTNCYNLRSISFAPGYSMTAKFTKSPVRRLTYPEGVTVSTQQLQDQPALEECVFPTAKGSAFSGCQGLKKVVFQNGFTDTGASLFNNCMSLLGVELPDNLTKINQSCFYNCLSITKLTVPETVNNIMNAAFSTMKGLKKLRFEGSTPPTVANSGAFSNLPTDCVISVPVGSRTAYTSATNYPSSGTYTYVEEAE